jgi:hypothetical protein
LATDTTSKLAPHAGFVPARARRGAAFVEAIIMLPIFTIVFFGVMYVKDVSLAAHEALGRARQCAWAYSKGGCEAKKLPAGCELKTTQFVGNTPDTLFRKRASPAAEPVEGTDAFQEANRSLDEGMQRLPEKSGLVAKLKQAVLDVVMGVADAFGNEKANLYGGTTVTPPVILGPKRSIGMGYRLACNTVPRDLDYVFGKLFEPINPF